MGYPIVIKFISYDNHTLVRNVQCIYTYQGVHVCACVCACIVGGHVCVCVRVCMCVMYS